MIHCLVGSGPVHTGSDESHAPAVQPRAHAPHRKIPARSHHERKSLPRSSCRPTVPNNRQGRKLEDIVKYFRKKENLSEDITGEGGAR